MLDEIKLLSHDQLKIICESRLGDFSFRIDKNRWLVVDRNTWSHHPVYVDSKQGYVLNSSESNQNIYQEPWGYARLLVKQVL